MAHPRTTRSDIGQSSGFSLSESSVGVKSLGLILIFLLGGTKALLNGHNVGEEEGVSFLDFLPSLEVGHPGLDLNMETIQGTS